MTDKYDEILFQAKSFNFSKQNYENLKELMVVARRAKLPLRKSSERGFKNELEFSISLTGAMALYESYMALGNEEGIVYMNENGQTVYHYADGRKVIK